MCWVVTIPIKDIRVMNAVLLILRSLNKEVTHLMVSPDTVVLCFDEGDAYRELRDLIRDYELPAEMVVATSFFTYTCDDVFYMGVKGN